MVKLSHAHLLAFSHQWYWIASDRIGVFDKFLRRPIRRMEKVRERTKSYIELIRDFPDTEPDTLLSMAFQKLLDELQADSEETSIAF